jgi:hypothetical protein
MVYCLVVAVLLAGAAAFVPQNRGPLQGAARRRGAPALAARISNFFQSDELETNAREAEWVIKHLDECEARGDDANKANYVRMRLLLMDEKALLQRRIYEEWSEQLAEKQAKDLEEEARAAAAWNAEVKTVTVVNYTLDYRKTKTFTWEIRRDVWNMHRKEGERFTDGPYDDDLGRFDGFIINSFDKLKDGATIYDMKKLRYRP